MTQTDALFYPTFSRERDGVVVGGMQEGVFSIDHSFVCDVVNVSNNHGFYPYYIVATMLDMDSDPAAPDWLCVVQSVKDYEIVT